MVDYKEVVRVVDDFRNMVKQMESVQNILEDTIVESDKAFGDVRHYIELKDVAMTRHEKSVVCRALKDASNERRKAKRAKEVLTPMFEFLSTHKSFVSDIGKLANDLKKSKQKVEAPHSYKVRVLTDIFGEDIIDGEVKLNE